MNTNRPDYSVYHLHELERALKRIDAHMSPEEAEEIQQYIAKGGYSDPENTVFSGVRFTSDTYKWFLVTTLTILLATNLAVLGFTQRFIAILPIAFQGSLLFMIFTNHKNTRLLIKLWSVLIVVSGSFGLFSLYLMENLQSGATIRHLVTLLGGILFFFLSNRFVQLVPYTPDNTSKP